MTRSQVASLRPGQGAALEAVQAQAGHLSIESTRVYLHLASDWLAGVLYVGRPPGEGAAGHLRPRC